MNRPKATIKQMGVTFKRAVPYAKDAMNLPVADIEAAVAELRCPDGVGDRSPRFPHLGVS